MQKRFQVKIGQAFDEGRPLLFTKVGSGKTWCVVEYFKRVAKKHNKPCDFLVIAPRKVIGDWYREIRKRWKECEVIPFDTFEHEDHAMIPMTAPHCRIILARHRKYGNEKMGYALRTRPRLKQLAFRGILVDESQHIKNHKTNFAKECHDLARHFATGGAALLCASGSPMNEGPQELWSQFEFCYPGTNPLGQTYYKFLNTWFIRGDYQWALLLSKEKAFYDIVNRHVIRFDEEDFQEFSESVPTIASRDTVTYTPSDEQLRLIKCLYKDWELPTDTNTGEDDGIDPAMYNYAVELLGKEIQICSGFYYIYTDETKKNKLPFYLTEQPKAIATAKAIKQAIKDTAPRKDGKVIYRIALWHVFAAERPLLKSALEAQGINPVIVTEKNLVRVLDEESSGVFIISRAYSEGVNHFANIDRVFIYSNAFSGTLREQLEGRHRRLSSEQEGVHICDICNHELADGYVAAVLQSKAMSEERLVELALTRKYKLERLKESTCR